VRPLHGKCPFNRLAKILYQVKTIGHLNCVRRPSTCSFGVQPLPIARHHPDSWMPFQPLTQGFGGSYGQNVHGSPALQINHDAAEILALVPSPIIYTNRPNPL
jgi:hypothetical protein